jgi:hypothetical protein
LEGGPPCFPQTHRGSWYSGCTRCPQAAPLPDSHRLWWCLPAPSGPLPAASSWVLLQPQPSVNGWFGLLPVRSPLLGESPLISLGPGTEMFQFPGCPPRGLSIQPPVSRHHPGRVAPFGLSGLLACMQLPLNVSPVSASFFGLQRLGILRVLSGACSSAPLLRSALYSLFFLPRQY